MTLCCAFALAITQVAGAAASGTAVRAQVARRQSVADTAHLRLVGESGADLLEEGYAAGGFPGHVQVRMNFGASAYGNFTIKNGYGSISGWGSAALSGTGRYASYGGSMTVTHGTGRYAHVHGHGGFYGTIERNPPYAIVVQTTGALVY